MINATDLHIDLHIKLTLDDLSAGRPSYAADRERRIAAQEAQAAHAAHAAHAARRGRRLRCPCELGNLWRGVPRSRRRHAVLCKLWVPPPSSAL